MLFNSMLNSNNKTYNFKTKIRTVSKTPFTSQGHTKVKNVHNMLSHGDTLICQNLICLCQRAKTSC